MFLIRHGETVANITGNDEDSDTLLTPEGEIQAMSWQDFPSSLIFDVELVLTSPLRRAIQTACLIFQNTEIPIEICRYTREHWWHYSQHRGSGEYSVHQLLTQLPRADEIQNLEELEVQDKFWNPEQEELESKIKTANAVKSMNNRAEECTQMLQEKLSNVPQVKIAVVAHWMCIYQLII